MHNFSLSSEKGESFIAKVYAWLTVGLGLTMATAYLASTGEATVKVPMALVKNQPPVNVMVTETTAMMINHPFISAIVFLVIAFGARMVSRVDGFGAMAYLGFTAFTGLFITPCLVYANFKAGAGLTMTANPVRDAAVLSIGAFIILSVYALKTKRDFSAIGGFLLTGLWCLIGAMLLNFFFQSSVLSLAISSVALLIFGGFVLYDTQEMAREADDAIGCAMNLYLDVLNIFLHILSIFTNRDLPSLTRTHETQIPLGFCL